MTVELRGIEPPQLQSDPALAGWDQTILMGCLLSISASFLGGTPLAKTTACFADIAVVAFLPYISSLNSPGPSRDHRLLALKRMFAIVVPGLVELS